MKYKKEIVFGCLAVFLVATVIAIEYDLVASKDIEIDVNQPVLDKLALRQISDFTYSADCLNDLCSVVIQAEYKGKRRPITEFEFDKEGYTTQQALNYLETLVEEELRDWFNPTRELLNGSITLT